MIKKLFIVILFLAGTLSAGAQIMPQKMTADSIQSAFLPVVSYSSDVGLVGGAIFNRYNYSGDIEPFNNYLKSTAVISTKGYIMAKGQYEQTKSFGSDIRSNLEVFFYRFRNDNYFGLGNSTSFTDDHWKDHYYFFESITLGFDYKGREPVYSGTDHSQLDIVGGFGTEYKITNVLKENSSFNMEMPPGHEGGWVNYINAGFIWENRDSEFDPHRGNRIEFELRYAPDLISDFGFTTTRLELRKYFRLFHFVTVANRLEGRHAAGDVPFWEFSTLGDDETLRGYPLNRFQGYSSISYNLELRSWIFNFPELQLKLGGQLFTDIGRVFTRQDDIYDITRGYKQTVGIGGAMSVFNPDFILRGDLGFSKDMSRIYVGIGYLF